MATLTRNASAGWGSTLKEGNGSVSIGERFEAPYSYLSRFERGEGTNPEELLAAAHASCYAMALAHALDQAGYAAEQVETRADVAFDTEALAVSKVVLNVHATVARIDEATFQALAEDAKANCPISKALAAVEVELAARLEAVHPPN